MHFLIPLSLILTVLDVVHAVKLPFHVRTSSSTPAHRIGRRAVPIANNGNAEYISNITLAGTTVSVILDTGSSDLWVSFPGTAPSTTDLGKSLSLSYAVGSASGNIHTAQLTFDGYTVEDQAFLLVANASSFSSDSAYDGLVGLGPNEGSQIQNKIDSSAGDTMLNRIFSQNKTTSNYITFLLDRKNDPGETLTGQFTIAEAVAGFENITSQTKLNVETVHKLLEDQQHWQALTDKDKTLLGPDGNYINIDSIVPKAPDGQLVAVFDSGFTFSQVPRDMSDAIYGRVQGAVYDTTNEWWTVPCGQMLNLTFSFGGVAFPIHPLDAVDDNFKILDKNGNHICIGAFQPITSAFSLFGNFDMIMGMTFLRNAYTLMDFGDWAESASSDRGDPYIQLLPLTNPADAHAAFVKQRLAGVDTTGASQYTLLPADQQQHSPVSEAEKKAKYEEMILSRWPYILVGCLVFVALVIGLIVWRCCCRRKGPKKNKGFFEQKSQTYLPLQVQGGAPSHHQQGYPQQGYSGGEGGYTGYNG
ncbi:aspartic peptidase domain-containing protein [Mycena rosella]|uniref:Aspartic peptidase domain-containing protein n=1 Tax=Mycena rosella TaxID=1033263 RepID=A0AAD7D1A9_MYCRO|nr:aspartic peptidase domain-containing protein [Mycena rosella]